HRELLHLRQTVDQYQEAISELKSHLHQVFSVAGGLGVLPLSETTRAVLGIEGQLNATNSDNISALQPPTTPITPGNSAAAAKKMRIDHLHELDTKFGPHRLEIPIDDQHLALSLPIDPRFQSSRPAGNYALVEGSVQTDPDALVVSLQQTVVEQRSDIEDLETSLRERKTLVRQLRKQLRDKELKQFAAASDCAGLRRTASIMGDGGCLSAHIHAVTVDSTAAHELPVSAASLPEDACCMVAKPASISQDSGCNSEAVGDKHSSNGTDANRHSSRRPSRFINGWPVYDNDENNSESSVIKTDEQQSQVNTEMSEMQELPTTAQVAYKQSVASELNNDGKSTSSLSKASTHRLFRSMVAKTPRRMFSSLSSKLKRS
ncbi:hypothetical protein FB639_002170, partial [Coemansia asiatica]